MFHWKKLGLTGALPVFKTRNKNRDQQNDTARFMQIEDTITRVKTAVDLERSGLEKRFKDIAYSAASLAAAEENAEAPKGCNETLQTLTQDMVAYNTRMKQLSQISTHLQELFDNTRPRP